MDLLDPKLTPGGALDEQIRRFLDTKFPFDRRPVAEKDAERFKAEGVTFLQILDYARFPDLIDRLWTRHRELMDPVPRPGEPKPWSAADEIKRTLHLAQRWQYEPRIIDLVQQRLEDGETIVDWLPFEVPTSKRKFDRRELRDACRYVTETNNAAHARRFLSDAAIDRLVENAAEQQRRAEVPTWASSRNYDLPGGVR